MTTLAKPNHAVALQMATEIERHLVEETGQLDHMISTCRELQRQLHQRPSESSDQLPIVFAEIQDRRQQIDRDRLAIVEKLRVLPGNPASISGLLALLESDDQLRIRQLRSQIFDKLEVIRSITLGSQMVLYYSLDFYHRLMRGLAGSESTSSSYSPQGRKESVEAGQVILKNC